MPISTSEATRLGSCRYCSATKKFSTAGGSAANSHSQGCCAAGSGNQATIAAAIASPLAGQIKPPTSSYSLVRTYQREVERQRKMVLKAEHAHQRLLLVVQGLKKLFADEHFVNLLRAEGLDTLPKYLAERIDNLNGAAA